MVVGRQVGLVPVVVQVPEHQHGHQVGGRQRGGGVPGAGLGAAADRVHPQLGGQAGGEVELAGVIGVVIVMFPVARDTSDLGQGDGGGRPASPGRPAGRRGPGRRSCR